MKVIKAKCLSFFLACSVVRSSGRTSGWESHPAGKLSDFSSRAKSPSHKESGELLMEYWEHFHPSGPTPPWLTNDIIKNQKETTGTQEVFLVDGNINTVLLLRFWTEMVHCVLFLQNFHPSGHDLGLWIKALSFPEVRATSWNIRSACILSLLWEV